MEKPKYRLSLEELLRHAIKGGAIINLHHATEEQKSLIYNSTYWAKSGDGLEYGWISNL